MENKKYTLLTCMDARLDPLEMTGFKDAEAFVIRNAGGRATDEAIDYMLVTEKFFNANEWWVIHHTDCLMGHMPDDKVSELPETIKDNLFLDLEQSVIEDIEKIKSHRLVSEDIIVKGFIYDLEKSELINISQ